MKINAVSLSLAIGISALLPAAAHAQDATATGFYVGVDAGVSSLNDAQITYYDAGGTFGGTGSVDTASAKVNSKSAFTIGAVLGYDFGTIRTDLEIDYARNRIRSLTFNSLNGTPVTLSAADRQDVCDYLEADTCGGSGNTFEFDGSRVRQLSAMGNLWVDLPIGSTIVPYAGGGVGIAGFEVDGEGTGKFAWQIGAGVAAHVSENVALTLDYRHRQVGRTNIEYDSTSGFELSKLKSDALTVGARFTF